MNEVATGYHGLQAVLIILGLTLHVLNGIQLYRIGVLQRCINSCSRSTRRKGQKIQEVAYLKRIVIFTIFGMAFLSWFAAIDVKGMYGYFPPHFARFLALMTAFLVSIALQEYALATIRVNYKVNMKNDCPKPVLIIFWIFRISTPLVFLVVYILGFMPYSTRIMSSAMSNIYGIVWVAVMLFILERNLWSVQKELVKARIPTDSKQSLDDKRIKRIRHARIYWGLVLGIGLVFMITSAVGDITNAINPPDENTDDSDDFSQINARVIYAPLSTIALAFVFMWLSWIPPLRKAESYGSTDQSTPKTRRSVSPLKRASGDGVPPTSRSMSSFEMEGSSNITDVPESWISGDDVMDNNFK